MPKIYLISKNKKLFYFDMEYINGSTLSLYLMSQPISSTYKIINELIKFIFNCKKNNNPTDQNVIFQNKIKSLQKKKFSKDKYFLKIFKILRNYNWHNIETSPSHGDLSLENIIIKNKFIKFIDISVNFVESYKLDISKLMFDLICLWSFRNVNLKIDQLKIYSLKRYLIEIFSKKLSKDDFIDVKMLIMLDFIRVLDYTNKKDDLNLLRKKLKHFYENFDTPLRW